MKTEIKRKCFVCEKSLVGSMGGKERQYFDEAPSDALVFIAHGNYGSTIFDPMPSKGERLEISICDECVLSKSHLVFKATIFEQQPKKKVENWKRVLKAKEQP